jgi:hypothetical protein
MHAPTEEKSDASKDSSYEELEQVFNHFPKFHAGGVPGGVNAN